MKLKPLVVLLSSLALFQIPTQRSWADGRYFFEGDGSIRITNSKTGIAGVGSEIRYRAPDGSYSQKAVRAIDRAFGVPHRSPDGISLRLVALLDYLQDHFKGHFKAGSIRLLSGYRSPKYNEGLRRKGKLAGKTSLHIEGMAADIEMEGVDGKTLWNFVRGLNCCGAGYYHGKGIHIDTGPNRFWDEKTTKVGQNLGAHNRLILLRTDRDIYQPGETVHLTLARITDYPIGVRSEAILLNETREIRKIRISDDKGNCLRISNRREARALSWKIPTDLQKERIQIGMDFCQKPFPEMPDRIESNLIKVWK